MSVDSWPISSIEQMGSKPKVWLEGPRGVRWLFKEATTNPKADGTRYAKGDDWSEVITSELGRAMGVSTASVEFASWRLRHGVVSRSIARGAGLIHGNEVLSGLDPSYTNASRSNPRYTVTAAMAVMETVDPPADMFMRAQCAFAGYLVLDALVGNTDRHHENWALLKGPRRRRRLAPSFDHASSLGFLLNDEERLARLETADRNRSVEAFAARARTPFADADSPVTAATLALAQLQRSERDLWRDLIREASGVAQEIVDSVPASRMSDVARRFAVRVVQRNSTAIQSTMHESR